MCLLIQRSGVRYWDMAVVRNYTSFATEIMREITSSKHERYTRNGANRISSLTRVSYTCFRAFELVFWRLLTRDIVYWETTPETAYAG